MLTIKKYVRAQSLEEAWQLNQNKHNRILGGMLWLRLGHSSVNTAIDLCDLGLNSIDENKNQFSIGSMVSLRDLELHESLNAYTNNAIRNAVKNIVGVQFRNMATVGGSIWGRFGFSSLLTVFLAMDCYVELYKGGIVSLEKFSSMKADKDVLVRLIIKKRPVKIVYSSMCNQRTDFPVITCAVSQINGRLRAVIGARPGRATVIRDTEGLCSECISPESAKAFASYTAEHTPTGSNLRGSAAYRTHLVRVLTERAVLKLGGI